MYVNSLAIMSPAAGTIAGTPSEKQAKKIENALRNLGHELLEIRDN